MKGQTVEERKRAQAEALLARKELKRRRIMILFILSAEQLIREDGVRNLTIRKIADATGYSSATLYSYFADLNELILYASVRYRKEYLKQVAQEITPEMTSLEQYRKIYEIFNHYAFREPEIYMNMYFGKHSEKIKEVLASQLGALKRLAGAIAMLDCLTAFASLAKESGYCRPQIAEEGAALRITDGRHPVVEALSRERFVPNDTALDAETRTMVITGPNMAGKSTYMRQTALIVLMAHVGCFVPAKSAQIPVIDRIFTRVGASDNLILDQSTFMVEMTEVASIIRGATQNSLLILDEVGRGTSTFDGLSIAWAVLEYLTEHIRAKTLFATHYHELTELEGKIDGVKNYKVTVRETGDGILFLRKIVRGGANKSFGIEVARLAGIPPAVTSRAKEILRKLEKNDIARDAARAVASDEAAARQSEAERILSEIDMNNLTPMQAFGVLSDLVEKVRAKG